jgi:fibronectin-binding autotransporter adhesin
VKINKQHAGYGITLERISQNVSAWTCILLAAIAFCAANASAQVVPTLTWDAGNTTNGPTIDPGSGAWDTDTTTNFNWNNGTTNVSWTQTSITAPLVQNTVFSGPDGAYQVALDGVQIAVSNLFINGSGYTFSGSPLWASQNSLLRVADGKSVIFSNNFATINNTRVWQLGAGGSPSSMTVNGNIGGVQIIFTSTNGSTFYLAGNSAPSVVTINANIMQTNGTFATGGFSIGRPGFSITTQPTSGNATFPGVFTLDGSNTVGNFTTALQISRGGGSGIVIVQNGATMNLGAGGASGSGAQNIQIESELANNSHGAFRVFGGTVNVGTVGSGTAIGTILFNRAGSNPGSTAEFTQTGGVVNAWGGITFGAASGTFTQGIAALTNSGGFLYIGNGGGVGITRKPGSAPTNYIVLSGGTVGALSSWVSSVPMTLDIPNGNITFQCADPFTTPFNISLSGALTGPGGLNKSGGGILKLSGANNYAGSTVVSNGTLEIAPSSLPTDGPVILDGTAGSGVNSVLPSAAGQYWTINGDMDYTNGTITADFNFATLTPSTTIAPIQVNGNLAFAATPQVTIEGSNLQIGDYPLWQYTTISGTPPTTPILPAGIVGTLVNNTGSNTIVLHVTTGASPILTWAPGNGVWDLAASLNWKEFGITTNYQDGDSVQFDDTASGSSPITVTLNTTVNPTNVAAINTAKSYTITGSGAISGPTGVNVSGAGSLTLATSNTYTGGTLVSAPGQLNINNGGNGGTNSAIGNGPLNINLLSSTGAKIDNTSGQKITLTTTNVQNWNDDWTFLGSASLNSGFGPVTLSNSVVVLTVVSNTLEVNGPIGDNGNANKLVKAGNGALSLLADNSFSGGLQLGAGTLNFGSANCAGNGILSIEGGVIDNVSSSNLTLGGILSVSVPIGSGGTFTFLGTGNLDITADVNPNNGGQMFWNVVSNSLTFEGAFVSGNTTITKIGKGILILGGFGASQFTGILNEGEIDLAKTSGVAIGTGGQGFLVQSNAVAKITGSGGNQISNGSYIQTRLNAGGVLDLNGQTQTLDMLGMTNGVLRNSATGTVALLTILGTAGTHPTNALTLNDVNCQFDIPDTSAALNINGIVNGSGSLLKTGLGTLSLLQSNYYTGNTTISNGTLVLAFPGLSASSTVSIATNAALGTNAILTLNFANSDTNPVAALIVGGVSKPNGIYNATTDPLYITGTGSLQVTPPINPLPGTIQFSVSANSLTLYWPTNLGWILQSQTNGFGSGLIVNSNVWFDLSGSSSVTSTNLALTPAVPTAFFRLRHP